MNDIDNFKENEWAKIKERYDTAHQRKLDHVESQFGDRDIL
jgi:hypothetical protein